MSEEHQVHEIGRKRRASVLTRIMGHMNERQKGALPVLIAAELRLAKNPGIDALRDTLLARLMKIPRFRSKLVNQSGFPFKKSYFEEVKIDVGYHFEVYGYKKIVTEAEKDTFVNELKDWDFDMEKPVWKVVHIPTMEDGTCAVIFVVHHHIGDGNSLLYALMNKLIDPIDNAVLKSISHQGKRTTQQFSLTKWEAAKAYMYGIHVGLNAPFLPKDKKNPVKVKHRFVEASRVGKGKKMPVDQLKEIARTVGQGLSVNDVLLSCFTLGVFNFFKKTIKEEEIRKMVVKTQFPVDMRKKKQKAENEYGDPHNDWSLGMFTMPFAFADYTDLLLQVKKEIDKVKISPSTKIGKFMLPINFNSAPVQTSIDFAAGISIKNTFNLSNVIGPSQIVQLCGTDIADFSFYLFNPTACYVGLFSYNGFVTPSVNIDAESNVDPCELANYMYEGFVKIYEQVVVTSKKKA